jgi:RNA exonuclease 1
VEGSPLAIKDLLLSVNDMICHQYPLHPVFTQQNPAPGWVATDASEGSFSNNGTRYQLLAIDCEMCYTANGLELTRVSVVNENKEVVLDELVLPDCPILDYNTKYVSTCVAFLRDL